MEEAASSEDESFDKFIQSTVHNNMSFRLQTGEVKFSSLLLSLNSPEFDQMFGNSSPILNFKDMDSCGDDSPLTRTGVNVFKKALCSGRIELNSESFKDVYKLAYLFRIPWIASECLQYLSQNNSKCELSMNAYDSELLQFIGDSSPVSVSSIDLPFNFRVERLQMSLHNNVEIRLKEGDKILANSVVLALSSQLFDDFFSKRQLTVHQIKDFERVNVRQFITSLYSGKIELGMSNFREICKLCHVFKVQWMIGNCDSYLIELLHSTGWQDFEELHFIVEEARFLKSKFKRQEFIDSFIVKLNGIKIVFTVFVRPYIELIGYNCLSEDQIWLICQICKSDATFLLLHVKENIISNDHILDDVSIRFLRNFDLSCTVNPKLPDIVLQFYDLLSKDQGNVSIEIAKTLNSQYNKFIQRFPLEIHQSDNIRSQVDDVRNVAVSTTASPSDILPETCGQSMESLIHKPEQLVPKMVHKHKKEADVNLSVKLPDCATVAVDTINKPLEQTPLKMPEALKTCSESLCSDTNQSSLDKPTFKKFSVNKQIKEKPALKRKSKKRSPDIHQFGNDLLSQRKPSKDLLNRTEPASTSKSTDKLIPKKSSSCEKESTAKPPVKQSHVCMKSVSKLDDEKTDKALTSSQKESICTMKHAEKLTVESHTTDKSKSGKSSVNESHVSQPDVTLPTIVNSTEKNLGPSSSSSSQSSPIKPDVYEYLGNHNLAKATNTPPIELHRDFDDSAAWKRRYERDNDYIAHGKERQERQERQKRFERDRLRNSKRSLKEMASPIRQKSNMLYDDDPRISAQTPWQSRQSDDLSDILSESKAFSDSMKAAATDILKMMPANRMSKIDFSEDRWSLCNILSSSRYIRVKKLEFAPWRISNYTNDDEVSFQPPKSMDDLFRSSCFSSCYMLHEGLSLLKQKNLLPEDFSSKDFEMIEKITDWNEWAHVSPKFTCVYKNFSLFLKGLKQINIDKCCSKLGSMDLSENVFGISDPFGIIDFVSTERRIEFHVWKCIMVYLEITPINKDFNKLNKFNNFNMKIYKTGSRDIMGKDLHVVLESQIGKNSWKQHTLSWQGKPYICSNGLMVKWGSLKFKAGTKVRLVFFWNNVKGPYEIISRQERAKIENPCLCEPCVQASLWKSTVLLLISPCPYLTAWAKEETSPVILNAIRNFTSCVILICMAIYVFHYLFKKFIF